MYKHIKFEIAGNIAIIKMNRPEVLNAINKEVLIELDNAVKELKENDNIKVAIITGEGRAFVAGADIAEMIEMTSDDSKKFSSFGNKVFRDIETLDIPVIAAINGFALGGGCELSLACDIRISSTKAIFGQPEAGLGIIPGFGGTQRLARLIGPAKAKELILTTDTIDAFEAEKIGLVNKVVKPKELENCALEMADKIARKSQMAVKYAKEAINKGIEVDVNTGLAVEESLFGLCFATKDQSEGMKAFIEKRKPDFRNK